MMSKSILTLIFALVFLAAGYGNGSLKAPPEAVQDVLSEEAAGEGLDVYMESVRAQSDAIRASLEQDALTQLEMNEKSQELCMLWDAALDRLLAEAERSLPEDEFAALSEEQRVWLSEKESAMQEAGREFEGGSIYALAVNMEAARLAQERASELYAMF